MKYSVASDLGYYVAGAHSVPKCVARLLKAFLYIKITNMNIYYILKNKKPVPVSDVLEWGRFFEKADRIVKQETLPNEVFVSTVFLGLDHNFGWGKPLLFETMAFVRNEAEIDSDRYSTWEEAEKGHKRMVKKCKELTPKSKK